CLEASSIGLVRGIFRSGDCQRVKDLRLGIIGILRHDLLHGVAIRDQARLLRRVLEVPVQLANGSEIRLFTLGLFANSLATFHTLTPCLQLTLVFNSWRKRITPIAQRDSPVRDSTARVLF